MKQGNWQGWRKYSGMALLAGMSVAGMGLTSPGQHFCARAQRVIRHYQELANAEVPTGLWSRIAYSLVLASADSTESAKSCSSPSS